MEKKQRPLQRSAAPRRRPPTSNYYRSGATGAASTQSPFRAKIKASPRVKKLLSRTIDIIMGAVLVIGLVYSLIINPTPKVEVNNTFYHSADNYRDSAKAYFGAFKNRNKISFD